VPIRRVFTRLSTAASPLLFFSSSGGMSMAATTMYKHLAHLLHVRTKRNSRKAEFPLFFGYGLAPLLFGVFLSPFISEVLRPLQ